MMQKERSINCVNITTYDGSAAWLKKFYYVPQGASYSPLLEKISCLAMYIAVRTYSSKNNSVFYFVLLFLLTEYKKINNG